MFAASQHFGHWCYAAVSPGFYKNHKIQRIQFHCLNTSAEIAQGGVKDSSCPGKRTGLTVAYQF